MQPTHLGLCIIHLGVTRVGPSLGILRQSENHLLLSVGGGVGLAGEHRVGSAICIFSEISRGKEETEL